ncbi:MAG: hypothetical protein JO277_00515 [Candidatus Eremiobacteraeota bacterium]|nr:hypothetical protein [Candidatus Eremiobacteraeota bacterium]MBV8720598.1 hypothetical protein [Candidatus Eremiobacteraeota bacterium]
MLEPRMRGAINREYVDGQEVRKDPSPRYMAVQRLAVSTLAFKPHDEAAALVAANYLAEAIEWRERAIKAKLGDPLEGLL